MAGAIYKKCSPKNVVEASSDGIQNLIQLQPQPKKEINRSKRRVSEGEEGIFKEKEKIRHSIFAFCALSVDCCV